MSHLKIFIYSPIIVISINWNCYAQEFNLFQEIEQETDSRAPVRSNIQNGQNANTQFILKSTSRFGDKYIVRLATESGETREIEWIEKKTVNLAGYNGYSLVDVNSRRVTLMYPENVGCTDDHAKGVKCNGPYMILSMTYGKPIEIKKVEEDLKDTGDDINTDESIVNSNQTENDRLFLNPFSGRLEERPQLSPEEEARREERRARRAEMFRDFEVVRIPDDDIPEGMQRVRTPFGDSLEPISSE